MNAEAVRGALERALGPGALGAFGEPASGRAWPLAAPDSEDAWRALFELCNAHDWKVLPVGLRSKLGWCRPCERADLVVSTARWRGIVHCDPAEGTVVARAGTTLAELAAAVAAGGHALSPDVPGAARATLGGALAAAQSGFDRTKHGPIRDQVLGMRVLGADGAVAKTGGRLVKNVTGYDLHKLYCGSHGSLGVILEAALRLYPRAPSDVWISAWQRDPRAVPAALLSAARAIGRSSVRPRRVAILPSAERGLVLDVQLSGAPRATAWERDLLAGLARAEGLDVHAEEGGFAADEALARHGAPARAPLVECFVRPSDLAALWERVRALGVQHGFAPECRAHPLIGNLAFAACAQPEVEPAALAASVRALRAELAARGGRVFLRDAPPEALREVEPFGELGPELALMQRLRAALDPGDRFVRGRLHKDL